MKKAGGLCEKCSSPVWPGSKSKGIKNNLIVDHIFPCGKLEGDIEGFCLRLFCDASGLQVLCKECDRVRHGRSK